MPLAIKELHKDLCDYYNSSRLILPENAWPPYQPTSFVSVAIIHYGKTRTQQELIEISKRFKEGAQVVDELVQSRATKDLNKIFSADPTDSSKELPKWILIEGSPGIGKTILAKELVYLWANGKILQKYTLVFLVYLRDPKIQKIESMQELLQIYTSKTVAPSDVEKYLENCKGQDVAFVFDGFDEFPVTLQEKSFITSIITRERHVCKDFNNLTIVVTSRPTATLSLHRVIDRRIEILGFAKEERDRYISLSVPDCKAQEMVQYLDEHPIIDSLCFIPLHLAILLYLLNTNSLPKTLTEMNELFVIHTIYCDMKRVNPDSKHVVKKLTDLPNNIYKFILKLSKLAFKGLQNNQLVFSDDEIKKVCPEIDDIKNGYGLVQAVQHYVPKGAGTTTSFNFIHFTMQEYLAALHVSTLPDDEQLSLMKKTFWDDQYNFMWMMYVGITGIHSSNFVLFVSGNETDVGRNQYKGDHVNNDSDFSIMVRKHHLHHDIQSDKRKCLHLLQCYMEADCTNFPHNISSIFSDGNIKLTGVTLLPHHILSLVFFMSASTTQHLRTLDLGNCNLRSIGMNSLLGYVNKDKENISTLEYVDLSGNHSSPWGVYCAIIRHCCVNSLTLCGDDGMEVDEIIKSLEANAKLESLTLYGIGRIGVVKTKTVLLSNTTLTKVVLSRKKFKTKKETNTLLHTKCPVYMLDSRAVNSNDRSRVINIKILDDHHYGGPLSKTVDLSKKGITSDNDILTFISIGLYNNTIVSKLDLSHNTISDDGTEAIGNCLKRNNTLKELDLSHNIITEVGMKRLRESVENQSILEYVDLSGNNSSPWSVYCVIIRHCCVKSLTLCGDDGMKECVDKIIDSLRNASSLTLSSLTLCSIGRVGVRITENVLQVISHSTKLCKVSLSRKKYTVKGIEDKNNVLLSTKCMVDSRAIVNSNNRAIDINILDDEYYYRCTPSILNLSKKGITADNDIVTFIAFGLCNNTKVWKLDLSHNSISDDGAEAIGNCLERNNTLKELDLSHNNITEVGMEHLLKSVKKQSILEYVDLSGNNSSQWGVYCAIIRHCCVNSLTLCGDYGMKGYAKEITDNLKKNKGLESLTFYSFGKIGLHETKQVLVDSTTLREVNLSLKKVRVNYEKKVVLHTRCPVSILDGEVNNNNRVIDIKILDDEYYWKSTIDLSKKGLTAHSDIVTFVSIGLYNNTMVWKLDLSHNSISDDGAIEISKCMQKNSTLKVIDLSHNNITTEGMNHLKSDKNPSTLEYVDFSGNNSSPWGVYCAIIKHCCNSLTLCGDDGMEEYVMEITDSLEENRMLESLTLCSIGRVGVESIKKSLNNTTTLCKVNLSWKKIKYEEIKEKKNIVMYRNCSLKPSDNRCETSKVGIYILNDDNFDEILPKAVDLDNNCDEISPKTIDLNNRCINNDAAVLLAFGLHNNTTLYKFNVSNNQISDDGAIAISSCLKSLQELNMSNTEISNKGAEKIARAIKANTALERLDISHCYIDNGMPIISNCLQSSSLKELNMSHNAMVNNCAIMDVEVDNTTLQKLDISYCDISDDGVVVICNFLKNLQEINMSHNKIAKKGSIKIAEVIKFNTQLQLLNISYCGIPDDGAIAISESYKSNKTLQELIISWNSDQVIVNTVHLSWKLSEKNIGNTGALIVSNLLSLNKTVKILQLSISHNNIFKEGVVAISDCLNNLQDVNMSHNKISFKEAEKIAELIKDNTTLVKLNISFCGIPDDGVVVISESYKNNKILKELIISWNNDQVIVNTADRECDLSGKNIGNIGALIVSNLLYLNKSIITVKMLNISSNNISDDGIARISDCLKNNNSLLGLKMSHNRISVEGAMKIEEALKNNKTLKKLDISYCGIPDGGAIAISESYKSNKTLQELIISWNNDQVTVNTAGLFCDLSGKNICNTGALIVSNLLYLHKSIITVKMLNISSNNISDDGIVMISDCLKNNNSLLGLKMTHNRISGEGAMKIAEALKNIKKLKKLDISYCGIPDDGAIAISESYKNNKTLQELIISWNSDQVIVNTTDPSWKLSEKDIGNTGALIVSNLLSLNKMVKLTLQLSIFHNNIFKEEVVAISDCLNNLQDVNMSHNKISFKEAEKIAELIKDNTTLVKLDISFCGIPDDGMVVISESYKNNKILQEFIISWNNDQVIVNTSEPFCDLFNKNIGNTGALIVSNLLYHNQKVTKLNICKNNIYNEGMARISNLLINNCCLLELEMSHNEISVEAAIKIAEVIQVSTTLQHLAIYSCRIPTNGIIVISESVKNNNSLRELEMSHNEIRMEAAIKIAEVIQVNTTLQYLAISSCRIPTNGIIVISKSVKNNSSLRELEMSHNEIRMEAAIEIAKVIQVNTTLQYLAISSCRIPTNGIIVISKSVKNNSSLRELEMSHNEIRMEAAIEIAEVIQVNTTLQYLAISSCRIPTNGIIVISKSVKNNSSLQELEMSHNEINMKAAIKIAKVIRVNIKLLKLDISYCGIPDDGAVAISESYKCNKTLLELIISWNNDQVTVNTSEPFCDLFNKNIGNTGALIVSNLLYHNQKVTKLNIYKNNICNEGMAKISDLLTNNCCLLELEMSHNEISMEAAIKIAEVIRVNTTLQYLAISSCCIPTNGIIVISESVKNNNSLRELEMSHNRVTMKAAVKIAEVIRVNNKLQKFDVSYCGIPDDGGVIISASYKYNKTLQEFRMSWNNDRVIVSTTDPNWNLSRNNIGNKGALIVSNLLYLNRTVKMLHISHNSICNDGVDAISDCLKNNNSLLEFNMSHNKITMEGANKIAEVLQVNTKLQNFDISCCDIFDDGIAAISNSVMGNKTLQALNVSHNKITAVGAIKIAEMIQINKTLKRLDISCSGIPYDRMLVINESYKGNKTLQQLIQ